MRDNPARRRIDVHARIIPLVLTFLFGATTAAQDAGLESRLKAAVVSKFPAFTEWPESALNGRRTIEICVARPNPFGTTLTELVAGETLRGRGIVVRELADLGAIDRCHVLFVSSASAPDRRDLLARARNLPVLTVGDYVTFLEEGGIIALRTVGGRIRFEIDVANANQTGIRLSSQLLRLALNVRGSL